MWYVLGKYRIYRISLQKINFIKNKNIWIYLDRFLEIWVAMSDCHGEILNFVQSTNTSCCYMSRNKYTFSYEIHIMISTLFVVIFIFNIIGNIGIWLIVPFKRTIRSPTNYLLLKVTFSHFISSVFTLVYCFTLDTAYVGNDS